MLWGLAMWAALGADLFQSFILAKAWQLMGPLCQCCPHSGHSHLPLCSQVLSVTIVGSKTFWKSLWEEGFAPLLWGSTEKPVSHSPSWERHWVPRCSSFCYLELTGSAGVHALPWGQRYAVKSAPHILDSLPYALGPGFPLADQGWEGLWGTHWAVPWSEVVPIL